MITITWRNYTVLGLLIFALTEAKAVEKITFSTKHITTQNWQLHGVKIQLLTPPKQTPQWQLSIQKLILPKPFNDLSLLDVRCSQFTWGGQKIACQHGTARIQSPTFQSPRLRFSFLISPAQSQFQIQSLQLFKGEFNLLANAKKANWQLSLNGQQCRLEVLHKLLFPKIKLTSGTINLSAKATGNAQGLAQIKAQLQTHHLSLQTADGTKAGEHLELNSQINVARFKKEWQWETDSFFTTGNLYIEPFYIENKKTPIRLKAQGYLNSLTHSVDILNFNFTHPQISFIKGYDINLHYEPFALNRAKIYTHIQSLNQAGQLYLAPFLATTTLEGLALVGELESRISIKASALTDGYFITPSLDIIDAKQRFSLKNGAMSLQWENKSNFNRPSFLAWKELTLYNLPLGRHYFPLLLKEKSIHLPKPLKIPFFNGEINIAQFDWKAIQNKSPQVHFAGGLHQVALEPLTQALKITPLSGYLSGEIPGITIADNKLSLDGGLHIDLFNGEIAIQKLAISGFMSDFTQFYSDIDIHHVDLEQLTQKFSFGGMQGKLSGNINDLYLENWQPISFYAWLGTDNDDASHQISQKAVNNIATIGGGGAIDAVSRTLLSVFDNFNYEKIGLGCYLHNNICQLMGVEAADYGYYIVKGGGLPRIDIMGYNTRIDWKVLQERLKRIGKTEKAVIE